MVFDRSMPGGGIEAVCRLENGKMFIQWRLHTLSRGNGVEAAPVQAAEERVLSGDRRLSGKIMIRIMVTDREGGIAAEGIQPLDEEEPLETILMKPRLWQERRDPFLYSLEAAVLENGRCLDRICRRFLLRTMEADRNGRLLLNAKPFVPRPVRYRLPGTGAAEQQLMLEDFRWLSEVGANCLCVEGRECPEALQQLCDRYGFLLFYSVESQSPYLWNGNADIRLEFDGAGPVFRGGKDSFFLPDMPGHPSSLYYRYKAEWGAEPFVYIVPESIQKTKSGNYKVSCYSNCSRIALYSDGTLFEVSKGEGEFVFQEVPVRTPSIILGAEGDGCSTALSFSKSAVS